MAKTVKAIEPAPSRLGRKKLTPKEKAERLASGYANPDVRFVRVAGIRVTKILTLMRNLRKCANTGSYEYTDKQVQDMLAAIASGVARLEKAFSTPSVNGVKKSGVRVAPVVSFFEKATTSK